MTTLRLAFGPNSIGNALAAAQALIADDKIEGSRKVIDFSGDSAYTQGGLTIAEARASALAAGIVINGLAILCRGCSGRPIDYDLEAAYAQMIIGGPGSFVITADKDQRFAAAVRRKLVLEIAGREVRWATDHPCHPRASGDPERISLNEIHSSFCRSRQRTNWSAPARARRTTGGPRSRP